MQSHSGVLRHMLVQQRGYREELTISTEYVDVLDVPW